MKKLLFATALVASAAAFATNGTALNAISFEGYAEDAGVGSGSGDIPEVGGATGTPYFWFEGDAGADGSLVKTFATGDAGAATGVTRPYYFQGETAAQYLELSTEGGTLWRSINESSASGLGTAQAVAADGTYFDALVQFTPTEDGGAPTLESADKLAIWLNVDSSGATPVTNLMVQAGYYDATGALVPGGTNLVLTGKTVVAGEWYRLTVKALDNIVPAAEEYDIKIPGFRVYIDSVEMSATTSPIDATYVNALAGNSLVDSTLQADINGGKYFPSRVQGTPNVASTLQGVGFKGSGALDDLVWTTENPFQGGSSAGWIDEVVTVFDGANLDATEKAKITAWATANNITVASGSEEIAAAAYLLNLTSLPAAIPDLTITSIEEGQDANDTPVWILTVAASVNDVALAMPAEINGAVMLKQAATLAGLASANASTATFAIAEGTATVTVAKDAAAAKFMKVGVGIAPPANAQQGQE